MQALAEGTVSCAGPVESASIIPTGAGHTSPVEVDLAPNAAAIVAVPLPVAEARHYDARWMALCPADGHSP